MKSEGINLNPLPADITAREAMTQRIAEKAYEIYERRGAGHGRDLDDWLEAERIVREEMRTRSVSARPSPAGSEEIKRAPAKAGPARATTAGAATRDRSRRHPQAGH